MLKYAMIGYYPNNESGHVYAVGNEGITVEDAKAVAATQGLEMFQLFPIREKETGQHLLYKLREDGNYRQGESKEFAARLSDDVRKLIEKEKKSRSGG